MPLDSDRIGADEDTVSIRSYGYDVNLSTSYSVRVGVLSQPQSFSMQLGFSGAAAILLEQFQPPTPFELLINGKVVQSGVTDGVTASGAATQSTVSGRDLMAALHDGFILEEQTFSETSYEGLVLAAFKALNIDANLISSNEANRKAVAGVKKIIETTAPRSKEVTSEEIGQTEAITTRKVVYNTITADLGVTWLSFLQTHLTRAGLFLWAAADGGGYVLSAPNTEQAPLYRIHRQRDQQHNVVTVLAGSSYSFNITTRYSLCVCYGRGGGGKAGRSVAQGEFIDQEMVELLNHEEADQEANDGKGEIQKILTFRDKLARTEEQCAFLARRKIAERNRDGFKLSYVVAGHSVETVYGERAVWAPDTIVEVVDEEFGLDGEFWIESVEFSRSPQTQTRLTLMRPQDLLFDTKLPAGSRRGRIRKSPTISFNRKPIGYSETRLEGKDPKTGQMIANTYYVSKKGGA